MKGRNIKHLGNITVVVHGSRTERGALILNASSNTHDPRERKVAREQLVVDLDGPGMEELLAVLIEWIGDLQMTWRRMGAVSAGAQSTPRPGDEFYKALDRYADRYLKD